MKPKSAARSKYGAESLPSFEERGLEGSVAELWMLKSPATRYGYLRSKRDDSGKLSGGPGEWSGIGVANLEAGKFCAETALRGKNI